MGVNVSDISTDLFLDPLFGEIDHVVNPKLCRNINPNQSESSTLILKILITNISKDKLTSDSQSVVILPTVLVLESTIKSVPPSEHQLYKFQTLPNYSMVMQFFNKLWRSHTYIDNAFQHYDMYPCEIEIDPEPPPSRQ